MNINPNWNCSLWELVIRLIQLLLIGAFIIVALRLCAWADEGARNLPVTTPAGVNGTFSRAK
jgi:hypothetical protein